ncbi:MAG: ECF transporter S component [Bacillota bacterium]
MSTKISTKDITLTAVLLGLCIVFQMMKGLSPYITGTAVNAMLVLGVLTVGWFGGVALAFFTPIVAYLLGLTPIVQMIPVMVLVIAFGNFALVLFAMIAKQKQPRNLLPMGLVVGSVVKALVLWVLVWFLVLPTFGAELPEAVVLGAKVSFSWMQLVTALLGSGVGYFVHLRTRAVLKFS